MTDFLSMQILIAAEYNILIPDSYVISHITHFAQAAEKQQSDRRKAEAAGQPYSR